MRESSQSKCFGGTEHILLPIRINFPGKQLRDSAGFQNGNFWTNGNSRQCTTSEDRLRTQIRINDQADAVTAKCSSLYIQPSSQYCLQTPYLSIAQGTATSLPVSCCLAPYPHSLFIWIQWYFAAGLTSWSWPRPSCSSLLTRSASTCSISTLSLMSHRSRISGRIHTYTVPIESAPTPFPQKEKIGQGKA